MVILFSCPIFADDILYQERDLLLDNRLENIPSQDQVHDLPEIHLYKDRLLKDLNSSSGVYSDSYYTKMDTGRLAFSYSHSLDIDDFIKIQSIDLTYMRAFSNSWQNFWWGLQYKFTNADLEAVTDEGASSQDDDLQTYSFLGFGLAHRFQTISTLLDSDRMFEMVSFFINTVFHKDKLEDQTYTGIGYNADYSFSFRSSQQYFYGGKISYNWALVEKPQEDNEALSSRSQAFGWTTIGFELGYIF